MGYTRNSKGTQSYEKKGRHVVTADVSDLKLYNTSNLENAIKENRPPEINELISELKCLCGTALYSLRGSNDVYKMINAIGQATRAVGIISSMEKVEELSPEVMKNMDDKELKDYVMKQLEGLK